MCHSPCEWYLLHPGLQLSRNHCTLALITFSVGFSNEDKNKLFTEYWWTWVVLTGLSMGAVVSANRPLYHCDGWCVYRLSIVDPAGRPPRQCKDVGEAFPCVDRLSNIDTYHFPPDNVPAAFRHSGKFSRGRRIYGFGTWADTRTWDAGHLFR
jgi:hypothetical protein